MLFPSLVQCKNSLNLPMQTCNQSVICKFRSPETSRLYAQPHFLVHQNIFGSGSISDGARSGVGGASCPPPPVATPMTTLLDSPMDLKPVSFILLTAKACYFLFLKLANYQYCTDFIINYGVLFHFNREGERCAISLKTTLASPSASVEAEW